MTEVVLVLIIEFDMFDSVTFISSTFYCCLQRGGGGGGGGGGRLARCEESEI